MLNNNFRRLNLLQVSKSKEDQTAQQQQNQHKLQQQQPQIQQSQQQQIPSQPLAEAEPAHEDTVDSDMFAIRGQPPATLPANKTGFPAFLVAMHDKHLNVFDIIEIFFSCWHHTWDFLKISLQIIKFHFLPQKVIIFS